MVNLSAIMQMPTDRLASEFNLAVFERQISTIEDVKALRRLAIRLHSTIIHQRKLYEFLIVDRQ